MRPVSRPVLIQPRECEWVAVVCPLLLQEVAYRLVRNALVCNAVEVQSQPPQRIQRLLDQILTTPSTAAPVT